MKTVVHIVLRRAALISMLAFALCAAAGSGGCTYYYDFSAFVQDPKPVVTSNAYRLSPPDVVLIESLTVDELKTNAAGQVGHQEQIRPDGNITMPLLGSVFVTGLTCDEASAKLEQEYLKDWYKNPPGGRLHITVRVAQYNSQKIYVFGEVNYPGAYEYDGTNSILGTLAKAQVTRYADDFRVHIIRPNKDPAKIKRMTIDPSAMTHEGDASLDSVLQEGDVIFVPAGPLAEVGLFLQQLLLPVQPAIQTVQAPANLYTSVRAPYRPAALTGGY